MGKIPPLAIIGITAVLIIALSVGALFKLIRPARATLAEKEAKLDQEQEKAAQLEATQEDLDKKTEQWLTAKVELDKLMEKRSIPISWGQPFAAMVASLWPEMRRDLADVVPEWVTAQGVKITSGASLPAAPNLPPPAPPDGFYQLATINLGVEGTLSEIERLYRALPEFPRIATISELSLTGEGDTISATLPMTIYLLAEVPAVAAAPAMGEEFLGPGMMGPGMMGPGAMRDRDMGLPGPPGRAGPGEMGPAGGRGAGRDGLRP